MVDIDWAVWPIFMLQVLALILMLLPVQSRVFKYSIRAMVMIVLIAVCIVIGASLYHDSTTILKLYF